jgi:hypothetical protein
MPTGSKSGDVRWTLGCAFVWLTSLLLFIAYLAWASKPELIATLRLSNETTTYVYAAGAFHHEPPGYLSLEVRGRGEFVVPRYEFTKASGLRIPRHPFSAAYSENNTVAAITQFKDAVFIIDFSAGEYWPPSGWSYSRFNSRLGDRLLEKLNEDTPDNYTCYFLEELIQQAARRKERLNDSAKAPTSGADSAK